jgi:hypothetical protein
MWTFIKILLVAFGLVLLGMFVFPLIGFVFQALWYLFWIALLGTMGYIGYKWLTKDKQPHLLEDKNSFALGGMDSVNKAFEDFKRKHLTK